MIYIQTYIYIYIHIYRDIHLYTTIYIYIHAPWPFWLKAMRVAPSLPRHSATLPLAMVHREPCHDPKDSNEVIVVLAGRLGRAYRSARRDLWRLRDLDAEPQLFSALSLTLQKFGEAIQPRGRGLDAARADVRDLVEALVAIADCHGEAPRPAAFDAAAASSSTATTGGSFARTSPDKAGADPLQVTDPWAAATAFPTLPAAAAAPTSTSPAGWVADPWGSWRRSSAGTASSSCSSSLTKAKAPACGGLATIICIECDTAAARVERLEAKIEGMATSGGLVTDKGKGKNNFTGMAASLLRLPNLECGSWATPALADLRVGGICRIIADSDDGMLNEGFLVRIIDLPMADGTFHAEPIEHAFGHLYYSDRYMAGLKLGDVELWRHPQSALRHGIRDTG
jgi:hypothetical protein